MKQKKTICFFALLFTIAIIAGCSSNRLVNELNDSYPRDLNVLHDNNFQTIILRPDWPSYSSVEEIVNASTNIYSGYVTDISFDIIDYSTGLSDKSPNSKSSSRTIYTIYTINLKTNYKGESPSEIKICKIGGIYGYKENEQYELLNSSKIIPDGFVGVFISEDDCNLNIGKEYLFCISRSACDFDYIINPYQFAHSIDSENAKSIIGFLNQ